MRVPPRTAMSCSSSILVTAVPRGWQRLQTSLDYCLGYKQASHLGCSKGTIIMLSEGYNHIIAGAGDSLSVLLQAMF